MKIEARAEATTMLRLPPGTRLWATMLMPDSETGHERCELKIIVKGGTRDECEAAIRAAAAHIALALEPEWQEPTPLPADYADSAE